MEIVDIYRHLWTFMNVRRHRRARDVDAPSAFIGFYRHSSAFGSAFISICIGFASASARGIGLNGARRPGGMIPIHNVQELAIAAGVRDREDRAKA